MKVTEIFALLSIWAFCACADENEVADGTTDFGIRLLNDISAVRSGNAFLSPYSISSALAMTYLGASGETKSQMAKTLGIQDVSNVNDVFKELRTALFDGNKMYTLREANRLYGKKGFSIKPTFLDTVQESHGAPLESVDFDEQTRLDINEWVAEQTEQKIKDLLHQGDLDGALLVLINAIYFKATWKNPFSKENTDKGQFKVSEDRSLEVDMMEQSGLYKIASVPDMSVKIIELPYSDKDVSMFILLPDDVTGLCALQSQLTAERLNAALDSVSADFIKLTLPKFEMNYRVGLNNFLSKYMPDAFSEAADFSAISETAPLQISDVIHQSFVRVDENGTEAAAATAVIMVKSAVVVSDKEINVDRPFIFVVRERVTKSTLFYGRLVDPTGEAVLLPQEAQVCSELASVAGSGNAIYASGILLLMGLLTLRLFQ